MCIPNYIICSNLIITGLDDSVMDCWIRTPTVCSAISEVNLGGGLFMELSV